MSPVVNIEEVRYARTRVMRPLFAYMVGRGMRRAWLAQQLGISRALLWRYEHGRIRVPDQFIGDACRMVGIPTSLITIPEPRDLYIQQPRKASAKSSPATSTPTAERTATR